MKIFLYQIYLHIGVEPAVIVLTTGSYLDDVDNMQMCAADVPHTLHALNSRLSGCRLQPALRICAAPTKKGKNKRCAPAESMPVVQGVQYMWNSTRKRTGNVSASLEFVQVKWRIVVIQR